MNWPTHHSRVLRYIHLVRLIELTPETKYNYVVVVVVSTAGALVVITV